MAQDNVDVIESAWAAFRRGDIDGVTEMVDPSCELVAPETLPWGGTYVGPDGFRQFFEKISESFEQFKPVPDKVLGADDDHVIVVVRLTGQTKKGNEVETDVVWIYRLRAGKVVSAQPFIDTARMLEALG